MSTTDPGSKSQAPDESNAANCEGFMRDTVAAAAMDDPATLTEVPRVVRSRALQWGTNNTLPDRVGAKDVGAANMKDSPTSGSGPDTKESLVAKQVFEASKKERELGKAASNKAIMDEGGILSFNGVDGIGNIPKTRFSFDSSLKPRKGTMITEFLPPPRFDNPIWRQEPARSSAESADQSQDERGHTHLFSGHPDPVHLDHSRKTLELRGPRTNVLSKSDLVPHWRATRPLTIINGVEKRVLKGYNKYKAPKVEDEDDSEAGEVRAPADFGGAIKHVERSQVLMNSHAQQDAKGGPARSAHANDKVDELQEKVKHVQSGREAHHSTPAFNTWPLVTESGGPVRPFARYHGVAEDRDTDVVNPWDTVQIPTRPRHERNTPSFGSMITEVPGYKPLSPQELQGKASLLLGLPHRPIGGLIFPQDKIATAVNSLRWEFDMKLSDLEHRLKHEEHVARREYEEETSELRKRLEDTEELKNHFRDMAMVMKAAFETSEEDKARLQSRVEELEKLVARAKE